LSRRRPKLKPYKISRGSLEEKQLREDNHMETQRALLFILPVVMIAVLAVGLFFGFKGYQRAMEEIRVLEHETTAPEATESDPMFFSAVSSARTLSSDYVPALVEVEGVMVSPDMADDLRAMLRAAEDAGRNLSPVEGYVSYQEQQERYESAVAAYRKSSKSSLVKAEAHVKRTIPRAGESEQQTGLVVRFDTADGKFEESAEYAWLIKNCTAYGFVLRYPSKENTGGVAFSPNLYRYVGKENAYYMTAYDMSFDEYILYLASQ
jgi:hypothetical protein